MYVAATAGDEQVKPAPRDTTLVASASDAALLAKANTVWLSGSGNRGTCLPIADDRCFRCRKNLVSIAYPQNAFVMNYTPVETRVSRRQAPYLRAQRAELFLDVFVAAIDMVNAIDRGVALGDESGQYQTR